MIRLLCLWFWVAAFGQEMVPSVERMQWLAGCWEMRTASGAVITEQWMTPAGGLMLGMARTVKKNLAVGYEMMRIESDTLGAIRFTAVPSGQREAAFRLTILSADSVLFENPAHDFPQRIVYRRTGRDSLTAEISGRVNGNGRRTIFRYRRIVCAGPDERP